MLNPVKYVSKGYRNLKLLYKPTREQLVTDGVSGTQTRWVQPAEYVQFENYEYSTDNTEIIAFLDGHKSRTGVTRTGKAAKILFERAMAVNEAQEEFLALVNEHGYENVRKMVRKGAKKPTQEVEELTPEQLLEKANKAFKKATRRLKEAEASGDAEELRKAKRALKKAEAASLEAQEAIIPSQKTAGG